MVSEVCAGGYGAGRVGEGSARSEERLVGRSAAGAAMGVEEAKIKALRSREMVEERSIRKPIVFQVSYDYSIYNG